MDNFEKFVEEKEKSLVAEKSQITENCTDVVQFVKQEEKEKSLVAEKSQIAENCTDVMQLVKQEEKELLETKELKEISRRFGGERIRSDLAEEASKIRQRNQETAEREFETETRELRLKHLREQLNRQHKYDMDTLEEDAKHRQTLNKRKKLVEKYGYLYNNAEENLVDRFDGNGEPYKAPKDFSYSKNVNKFRQVGRNISKLDKPILQTIKWFLIIGVIVGGIMLLKHFNII